MKDLSILDLMSVVSNRLKPLSMRRKAFLMLQPRLEDLNGCGWLSLTEEDRDLMRELFD